MLAPIAIFAYNRPDHLKRLLLDLKNCAEFERSDVFVFGDGPKSEDDVKFVQKTREVARDLVGSDANFVFSKTNQGLAQSIISGVGDLCDRYGQVIVVEDDLRVSVDFLSFLNRGLEKYQNDKSVFQVSGHAFAVPEFEQYDSALMLPFITTWGWATWSRAWEHFDPEVEDAIELQRNKVLRKKFNLGNCYDYSGMLEDYKKGKNHSWGIRWYWSVFRSDGLVLYPPRTLVLNQGFDGSGTHGRGVIRKFGQNQRLSLNGDFKMPDVKVDPVDMLLVRRAIYRLNGGICGNIVDKVKGLIRGFSA